MDHRPEFSGETALRGRMKSMESTTPTEGPAEDPSLAFGLVYTLGVTQADGGLAEPGGRWADRG
jgi:hypothetical protein